MQADERVKRVRRGLLWLSVAALVLGALPPVSYTHLTLPTTSFV